jgi:hypothetical protein
MAPGAMSYLYAVDHESFKLRLHWKANNFLRMVEAIITNVGHFLHQSPKTGLASIHNPTC